MAVAEKQRFLMKRVKTALLFNDKYKQGYSYIMASQSQLIADIALAESRSCKNTRAISMQQDRVLPTRRWENFTS
jgi:hypothetical protein